MFIDSMSIIITTTNPVIRMEFLNASANISRTIQFKI